MLKLTVHAFRSIVFGLYIGATLLNVVMQACMQRSMSHSNMLMSFGVSKSKRCGSVGTRQNHPKLKVPSSDL